MQKQRVAPTKYDVYVLLLSQVDTSAGGLLVHKCLSSE
jgi:hypothetical protein